MFHFLFMRLLFNQSRTYLYHEVCINNYGYFYMVVGCYLPLGNKFSLFVDQLTFSYFYRVCKQVQK